MMLHLKCERARVRMSLLLVVLAVVSLSLTPNHRSSLFNYCDAFQLVQQQPTTATLLLLQSQSRSSSLSSRRLSMSMSMSSSSSSTDSSTTDNSNSNASSTIKSVTVLGGTGFVGSRVCKILSDKGINVRSISKSGINGIPDWLLKEGITTTTTTTEEDSESDSESESENNNNNINWISLDILNVSNEELDIAMGQPDAIISCIGIIGTNPQQLIDGNGIVNVKGFESARRVSTSTSSTSTASTSTTSTSTTNNANNANALQSIAYVSVSSEVKACQDNWLPEFMESYFKAKNMAEQSALQQDGNSQQDVTIVSPTFIYGGDSFGLIPPRVNDSYGSFIDQLLSFVLFQKLADISPGLIKVALRPPVSVNAVANACVNGILLSSSISAASSTSSGGGSGGGNVNILDTAKDINDMAKQEPATGINDAIDWTIQTTKDAVNFIQEKVKEQN